jgi:hypothetical protein
MMIRLTLINYNIAQICQLINLTINPLYIYLQSFLCGWDSCKQWLKYFFKKEEIEKHWFGNRLIYTRWLKEYIMA